MTELDPSPHLSPLAQSVTRDGKSVRIDIYGNGKGGWILEVVDEYGNSTVWDDSFATDREALDEALNTINEDGIISLIGSPRFGQKTIELNQSLSEAELNELDDFLANESIEETSMDISTLEGFLTALAIGPRPVMPSEWIPWIFDMHEGKASPEFESTDEANRVLNLVMRHYNAVIRQFMADPAGFEPIYLFGDEWGAAEWCEGFLLGMQFAQAAWSLLMVGQPRWFTPFMRLGTDEGIELIKQEHDGERWMSEVVPSLVNIHAFWHERRPSQPEAVTPGGFPPGGGPRHPVVRDAPKVGRNDPCPCGSGKKYKKCCGADGPTLH